MHKKKLLSAAGLALSLGFASQASASDLDVDVSGFGSIVGTTLLGDEGYSVKHPSGAGFYDKDVGFDLKEESLLGLQGILKFDDDISVTAQVIVRGFNDFEPEISAFFATYKFNPSWSAKMGKMRNPVYLYSDYMDVHYAFNWLRTPGSSYSLSASDFDGAAIEYQGVLTGDLSNRTSIYYGQLNKTPDIFLTDLFKFRNFSSFVTGSPFVSLDLKLKDLIGLSTEFYYNDWTIHAAYMKNTKEVQTLHYEDGSSKNDVFKWRDFSDIAVSYDNGEWFMTAEWNQYKNVYTSQYIALGKYFDKYAVTITRGSFEGEVVLPNGFALPTNEFTDTWTATLRYDVAAGVALKTELVYFENDTVLVVSDVDGDGKINSTVLSVAIDFVF